MEAMLLFRDEINTNPNSVTLNTFTYFITNGFELVQGFLCFTHLNSVCTVVCYVTH